MRSLFRRCAICQCRIVRKPTRVSRYWAHDVCRQVTDPGLPEIYRQLLAAARGLRKATP